MSAPDRRAMVERPGEGVSVRRQCELLNVARSGVYRPKPVAEADDLALMRRIDELHLELPFFGSRRMTFQLNEEGRGVNRKRVQRLMRVMGMPYRGEREGQQKGWIARLQGSSHTKREIGSTACFKLRGHTCAREPVADGGFGLW